MEAEYSREYLPNRWWSIDPGILSKSIQSELGKDSRIICNGENCKIIIDMEQSEKPDLDTVVANHKVYMASLPPPSEPQ